MYVELEEGEARVLAEAEHVVMHGRVSNDTQFQKNLAGISQFRSQCADPVFVDLPVESWASDVFYYRHHSDSITKFAGLIPVCCHTAKARCMIFRQSPL